jgi:hypothetical protein
MDQGLSPSYDEWWYDDGLLRCARRVGLGGMLVCVQIRPIVCLGCRADSVA